MTNDDLHRTNINLYATDVEWLRKKYGYGWTEKVREIIHDWTRVRKAMPIITRQTPRPPR